MSSTTSIIKNVQPHDVTAWTYDIEMQMLKEEILKLKKNLTETTTKQIEEKEEAIAGKKVALEKHCRQFGMTYGKYGTGESEVKLEDTNNEEAAMTNGHVEMDGASTIEPTDTINTAASVAPDEIKSQSPAVNVYDSNGAIESIEDHQETNMAASHDVPADMDLDNPFITPAGHNAPPNLFHPSTGTFHDDPFNTHENGYASAFAGNNPFLDQNTGSTNIDLDQYLDHQETNYTTSAGHVGGAGMDFGGEDEMDMDTMASRAPMAEFEEPVIPNMDKYDNL